MLLVSYESQTKETGNKIRTVYCRFAIQNATFKIISFLRQNKNHPECIILCENVIHTASTVSLHCRKKGKVVVTDWGQLIPVPVKFQLLCLTFT